MRCTRYDLGDILPRYIKKDDGMVRCIKKNFERLGVLVRVDATPDEGKIITQSHGELINGEWVEVIDEQKTQAEIAAAEALAINKFSKLNIVRAMRALEKLANLQTLLDSNQIFKEDWDAAVEIDLSDNITQQAIEAYGIDKDAIKLKIAEL